MMTGTILGCDPQYMQIMELVAQEHQVIPIKGVNQIPRGSSYNDSFKIQGHFFLIGSR